jgi:transcriptional regulator with XRE-family HTH domain
MDGFSGREIGQAIRDIRTHKEMTLMQLSQLTNINHGTLSKIETGKQGFSLVTLNTVVRALGVPILDVMRRAGEYAALNHQIHQDRRDAPDGPSLVAEYEVDQLYSPPTLSPLSIGPYVEVPKLSLRVNAGNGPEPQLERVKVESTMSFRRDWLIKKGFDPAKMEIYETKGDSMSPYINDGDIVLVDLNTTEPSNDDVWVIYQGQPCGVRIKRLLLRENGDIIIRSDNPDRSRFPDEIVVSSQGNTIGLVGRVVWRGG